MKDNYSVRLLRILKSDELIILEPSIIIELKVIYANIGICKLKKIIYKLTTYDKMTIGNAFDICFPLEKNNE